MAKIPEEGLSDKMQAWLSRQHREIPAGFSLVALVDKITVTQPNDNDTLHQTWKKYESWKATHLEEAQRQDNHRDQFVIGFNPATGAEQLVMIDPDHRVKPANMNY